MGRVKSVYKAIEKTKIEDAYCMSVSHAVEIEEHANGYFDAIYDGFRFGYVQGEKAARSKMKRGGYGECLEGI